MSTFAWQVALKLLLTDDVSFFGTSDVVVDGRFFSLLYRGTSLIRNAHKKRYLAHKKR